MNRGHHAHWLVTRLLQATSYRPRATSQFQKPPPQPSPKGRETCPMRAAAVGVPSSSSSPSPRTTNYVPSTQRADTPVRPYGKRHTTSHKLQATSPFQKPPPRPSPKGREICLVTNREPQASSRLETMNHKRRNVAAGHKPQATSCLPIFPILRTRPARPAEIQDPCQKRSWGSVVVGAPTLERRGRSQTFPYR